MHRRDFLVQLAAGMASAAILLPGDARASSVHVGVVPLGKRGRVLAGELMKVLAVAAPFATISLIDANSVSRHGGRLDGVIAFGCLGGRTGLDDAAACGELVGRSTNTATAVVLWPMEFEGWRRRAAAHLAAGRLRVQGARVIPVTIDVSPDMTLDEARQHRERALIARGSEEIARICGGMAGSSRGA